MKRYLRWDIEWAWQVLVGQLGSTSVQIEALYVGEQLKPFASAGYLQYFFHGENRPRLLSIYNGTDILVEKWSLERNV